MQEQNPDNLPSLESIFRYIYINEVIFISLVVLSFFGDILGQFFERGGVFYWLLMTPVFFIGVLMSERAKAEKDGYTSNRYIKLQVTHWSGTFIAVLCVMLLWHAEAVKAQATGQVIHIILALSTFLVGLHLGLRFYLLGLFLFATAALTIAMEGIVAVSLLLAVPVVLLGLYYEEHVLFPRVLRNANDRMNDNNRAP